MLPSISRYPRHRLAGAVHFLAGHLGALYAETGTRPSRFSAVIGASYDGLAISGSSLIVGPFPW